MAEASSRHCSTSFLGKQEAAFNAMLTNDAGSPSTPHFPRHKRDWLLWKLYIRFHLAGWHQLERQQLQRRTRMSFAFQDGIATITR